MPAGDESELRTRVRELHRRAVESINSGRPVAGARMLRDALRLLGWPVATPPLPADWSELTARALSTLGIAEVYLGNSSTGLALLDDAETLVPPNDRGILVQQRGLTLVLLGRMDDALVHLDEAVPLLGNERDRTVLARTLLNRALLHQTAGRVTLALADLDRCERIGRELGDQRLVAKAIHGRGSCQLLIGDIPAALRAFDTAARGYAEHADGWLAVVAVDKARALLAAGLPADAAQELDTALGLFPLIRMDQEHAEAELTRAHAALAVKDYPSARTWARRAERRFRRRRNETWAGVAVLATLQAQFRTGRPGAVAGAAHQVADQLRTLGLDNDAEAAELLAARAHLARGEISLARQHIRRRGGAHAVLDTRLARRLALAELGAATGDRSATFGHARAGLALLREHRGRFGSLDVATGSTSLGDELAGIGLAEALRDGSPSLVFRWLELSRAQAFRVQPVFPPADARIADALAELRRLANQVRASELAGRREPEAQRRCAQLERELRERGWQVDGTGEHRAQAGLPQVRAQLAAAGVVLVDFIADGPRLRALTVSGRGDRLVGLGEVAVVDEAVARLHSDLDALCGRLLPPAIDQVIRASVRRQLDVLTEHLVAPLRQVIGDAQLVFVPTGTLSAVPWGLLPDLRGRPVTVAPSASTWLAARQRSGAPSPARALVVAGPNLDHAPDEGRRVAGTYQGSVLLDGTSATVEATLRALDGCTIAHFAAHGHHEQENVLFSRLDLADGPLMAYDVHQLAGVPEQVVLSSCDVGQTVVRTGDEILGFTAALLYSGTRTVVSSVARVDDQAAVPVMAAYHRALAAGTPPAQALAEAALLEPLMPLVCFGSG